jgi:exopolysaccharide biosynthesis polyprenyl glycosylphosphotransferase
LAKAFRAFDSFVLIGAFGVAAIVTAELGPIALQDFLLVRVKLQNFLTFVCLVWAWRIAFTAFGLYRTKRMATLRQELLDVAKATTAAAALLAAAGAALHITMVSKTFILVFWLTAAAVIMASRVVLRRLLARARLRGRNLRHVVIIGTNSSAVDYAGHLENEPELGYRVLGFVDDGEALTPAPQSYPVIGTLAQFSKLLETTVVDEVVVCLSLRDRYEAIAAVVAQCEEQGIIVRVQLDLPDVGHGRSIAPHPVVTLYDGAMNSATAIVKRAMDIVISGALLVATAPLWLILAILIKADSPGPILFRQQRRGLNKRPFTILKFRTMHDRAEERLAEVAHLNEAGGPSFKVRNDPRVTRVGRLLRRMSLDELPQLLNVLRGEMSLVGPRPLFAWEYDRVEEAWIRRRCSVKPGLTGLWQVSGRSDLPFDKRIELDLHYIDNWSLEMDFRILARTVPAVMRGRGAV